jgi:2-(1,2-epoxy-1,2-dihydrophenyl)acetyl-CoA isomerase
MAFEAILFEVREHVAYLTLNRPEVFNALDATLARNLLEAVTACKRDETVRAVLVTGAGNAFCAGGDLRSFAAALTDAGLAAELRTILASLHEAITRLTQLAAPVVAAVNGAAAGAGFSLVNACDLVLASESARFTVAYTQVGLTPDGSSTYFLPRRIGLSRALELTLTNRLLTAHEAMEWGIVNRVVNDADLAREARALAMQLAAGPTRALGAAKHLLRESADATLQEQLAREADTIARMGTTADAAEGIQAFLAKRPPRFTGR